ncbi:helix-turn-helix transcriptional regulator, partial [Pseudomonas aeruginosa]
KIFGFPREFRSSNDIPLGVPLNPRPSNPVPGELKKMAVQQPQPALLRLPHVCAQVALSKSQIYRLIRAGEFPAPVRLGANSVAWPAEQVGAWVLEKIKSSACE